MYPTIEDKAATYLFHLARNHPFNDGNKRTAYVTALVFLEANNTRIKFKISRLEKIVIEVAKGDMAKDELAHFFKTGNCLNSLGIP